MPGAARRGVEAMIGDIGDRIVPFSGIRKDMQFPCLQEIRAYWEALRNGRAAPARSEVDPRGIERSLEYAFILERIAPRVARFRLAGSHLNELMGMEVRGMPVTAFFAPSMREQAADLLEGVFSGPVTLELALRAEAGIGRPSLEARFLALPLRSDLGDMNRALGCLVACGRIGRAPRRFEIAGTRTAPIAVTAQDPFARQPVPQPGGFAEAPAGFAPCAALTDLPQPIRSRGHLHLIVSDE